jgi:hypothetical protein
MSGIPTFEPKYKIDSLKYDFFNGDDLGAYLLERSLERFGNRFESPFTYTGKDRRVGGSNILGLLVLDELLREEIGGVRVANPEEARIVAGKTKEPMYIDGGVTLNFSGWNPKTAGNLHRKLRPEHQDAGKLPAILTNLVIVPTDGSEYGFELEPSGRYPYGFRTTPVLSTSGRFNEEEDPLGWKGEDLPRLGKGSKAVYNSEEQMSDRVLGLGRLSFDGDGNIYNLRNLLKSTPYGQVVLVRDKKVVK